MARDEFTINMGVRFKPDEQSMADIKKTFNTLGRVNVFGGDQQQINSTRKAMNEFAASQETLKRLTSSLREYQHAMNLGPSKDFWGRDTYEDDDTTKQIKAMIKEVIGDNKELEKQFGQYFKEGGEIFSDRFKDIMKVQVLNKMEDLAKSFLQGIANVFKDAWGELKNIMQSSFMTNSTTRENMFNYGFSAAESYGFEQAKSMLGISSEEDLWYMNDMQRQKFQEVMTKYAEKYNKLSDSGFFDTMLEYQIEMEEFKKDVQLELVQFFVDNKDTIKTFMKLSMDFLKVIMQGVTWLVEHFTDRRTTDEEKAANIDSILNSYVQKNQSLTFNQSNSFYGGANGSYIDSSLNQLTAQTTEALKAFGE